MGYTIYQPQVMNLVNKSLKLYSKIMIKYFRFLMDESLFFNGAVKKRLFYSQFKVISV
jgi:hypothetical protein